MVDTNKCWMCYVLYAFVSICFNVKVGIYGKWINRCWHYRLKAEQGKGLNESLKALPTETADFIRLQISRSEGAKWTKCTPAIKRLGVQVYHNSQNAYRSLRRKFLLPSPSTLQRFINANVGPFQVRTTLRFGFEKPVLFLLKTIL